MAPVRIRTHGVLVLTLRPSGYAWRFEDILADGLGDGGSGRCG